MREKRVQRLLMLIQVLQSGRPATVDELASQIGVSRRTIFRDMELLANAGIPYEFDRVTKRYSTDRIALLPPVTLTHAESLALMIAARHALKQPFLPDQTAAASAGLKIESMLPQSLRDHCGPLIDHVDLRLDPTSANDANVAMSLVQLALVQRKKLAIEYDSYTDDRKLSITIAPYNIAFIHRGWYVIAYTQDFDEVRTYKIERIIQGKLLDEDYILDSTFNLDDYFGNAWLMIREDQTYHVKIRFQKMVAGNVNEINWHKSQQTQLMDDGSLLFEVDVAGIREIAWWVLGYGDQAEVIEPSALRTEMKRHATRMLSYYSSQNGSSSSGKNDHHDNDEDTLKK